MPVINENDEIGLIYDSKEHTLSFEWNDKLLSYKLINIPDCDENGGLFWCFGSNNSNVRQSVHFAVLNFINNLN